MYLQFKKSVKHNVAKSVNRSILKKSRHIGFGVFIVHSSMQQILIFSRISCSPRASCPPRSCSSLNCSRGSWFSSRQQFSLHQLSRCQPLTADLLLLVLLNRRFLMYFARMWTENKRLKLQGSTFKPSPKHIAVIEQSMHLRMDYIITEVICATIMKSVYVIHLYFLTKFI